MNNRASRRLRMGGFTLIEVLASMAVLVVLILALTRMFVEAANITKRGTTALARNSMGATAMESLLQDFEGMVVNERLACKFLGNSTDVGGFGFDEAWFVTTSGDQDDARAYQFVHYYVTNSEAVNSLGAKYLRFQLIRQVGIFANADNNEVDIMEKGLEWWDEDNWPEGKVQYSDSNLLAENVVRFDFYCLGWDGKSWMGDDGTGEETFSSIDGPSVDPSQTNLPPAAMDVYRQLTSPEVAAESGMALVAGAGVPAAVQIKAREMMFRESASLFGRASPIAGGGQRLHPTQHYTD